MKNNNIDAVVWDLDGTLLESGKLHFTTERDVFSQYGIEINEVIYKKFLSTKIKDFVTAVLNEHNSKIDPQIILDEIAKRTKINYSETIKITEHALYVLGTINRLYKQALATAREREVAMLALKRNSLTQYFDKLVFAEDVSEGKPNPEALQIVAEEFNIPPEKIMVVEDGLNGIKAAKSAKMVSIARLTEHNRDVDFSCADYVIDDLRQVLDILKEY